MDSQTHATGLTRLVRMFDSFLQEHNIKWVLGVGTLIVVGSSLMLVGPHWQQYTPIWKYMIMFTYTGVVYVASQWCYHRLLLHKTGTVLMGLTTLFFPILFAALNWVGISEVPTGSGTLPSLATLVLFGATLALALPATARIFRHFLRDEQPTFRAAYLVLCAAGSVAPMLPQAAAAIGAFALWLVFTAGSVKVSRHVFWLVEEHRQPRVLGFFPIALLGAQFLLVFSMNFATAIDLQWFGLGCALVAIPVLATTDALARVFQKRTGDIIRPLPVSIIVPLIVGLLLCSAAMVIASTGLASGGLPYAMVPTALVVAVSMGIVARRTNKEAFVWAAILCGLIAYNFSPVFFAELARRLIHVGEVALAEEQLPYAFYGLTYLPVMAILIGLASWARLRGSSRFGAAKACVRLLLERPARIASLIISIGLLALSVTHEKAILPVAAAMVVVLSVQTVAYRLRWLGLLVVAAVILAVIGVAPFSVGVLGRAISGSGTMVLYAGVAGILLALSGRIDRWLDGLKPHTSAWRILARSSAVITGALAVGWVLIYGTAPVADTIFTLGGLGLPLIIGALLVVHTLRWQHPAAATFTIAFGYLAVVLTLLTVGATATVVLSAITLLALAQWGISYALDKRNDWLVSRAFAPAVLWTSSVMLFGLLLFVHLPIAIADMIALPAEASFDVPWILRLASVTWAFDAARRLRNKAFGALGITSALALAGAVFIVTLGADAWRWLPMVWVVVCAAALPVLHLLRRRAAASGSSVAYDAITVPLDIGLHAVFIGVAILTLPIWLLPLRIAGLAAVGGLWRVAGPDSVLRRAAVALAQWQIVSTVFYLLTSPELTSVLDVTWPAIAPALLPAVLVATILRIVVPSLWPERRHSDLLAVNRWAMSTLTMLAVLCSLGLEGLTLVDGIAAGLTFVLLVIEQLVEGCSARRSANIWVAQFVAGVAVAYFAWFGIIHFGRGLSMFVVMAIGVVLWVIATMAERYPKTEVMAKPFFATAMILPAVTVCIGLARHFVFHRPGWLGLNSLGLLLAGGFYFWQGIERRRSGLLVLAAGILNISVMLLWRELSWSDPQFYMIPIGITVLALTRLLEREIPASLHDSLYYLGALVILVSPTFNIVGGSWMHLLSLMVFSTAMVFVAIGLRLRALVYAGAAFLVADLVAIVVRGSVDHPSVLWLAGLALGAAVIAVGAVAERNRERLLQRIRLLSAQLQTWS